MKTCESCGAPLAGAECEYCGRVYQDLKPRLVSDAPGEIIEYAPGEIIEYALPVEKLTLEYREAQRTKALLLFAAAGVLAVLMVHFVIWPAILQKLENVEVAPVVTYNPTEGKWQPGVMARVAFNERDGDIYVSTGTGASWRNLRTGVAP